MFEKCFQCYSENKSVENFVLKLSGCGHYICKNCVANSIGVNMGFNSCNLEYKCPLDRISSSELYLKSGRNISMNSFVLQNCRLACEKVQHKSTGILEIIFRDCFDVLNRWHERIRHFESIVEDDKSGEMKFSYKNLKEKLNEKFVYLEFTKWINKLRFIEKLEMLLSGNNLPFNYVDIVLIINRICQPHIKLYGEEIDVALTNVEQLELFIKQLRHCDGIIKEVRLLITSIILRLNCNSEIYYNLMSNNNNNNYNNKCLNCFIDLNHKNSERFSNCNHGICKNCKTRYFLHNFKCPIDGKIVENILTEFETSNMQKIVDKSYQYFITTFWDNIFLKSHDILELFNLEIQRTQLINQNIFGETEDHKKFIAQLKNLTNEINIRDKSRKILKFVISPRYVINGIFKKSWLALSAFGDLDDFTDPHLIYLLRNLSYDIIEEKNIERHFQMENSIVEYKMETNRIYFFLKHLDGRRQIEFLEFLKNINRAKLELRNSIKILFKSKKLINAKLDGTSIDSFIDTPDEFFDTLEFIDFNQSSNKTRTVVPDLTEESKLDDCYNHMDVTCHTYIADNCYNEKLLNVLSEGFVNKIIDL